jgi:hypothetical protein
LAFGQFTQDELVVREVRRAARDEAAHLIVREWIQGSEQVLLCVDAPLGWPSALGQALVHHRAGAALAATADALFARMTDQLIRTRFGKRPLEVGADRIARTARAALGFLADVGQSEPVPLAWSTHWPHGIRAIEVYPAVTRRSLRDPGGLESAQWIRDRVKLLHDQYPTSPHEIDAIICVMAGGEFLRGRALGPTDRQMDVARNEGWIWV